MWLKSDEKTCQSRGDQVEDFLQFEKITTRALNVCLFGEGRGQKEKISQEIEQLSVFKGEGIEKKAPKKDRKERQEMDQLLESMMGKTRHCPCAEGMEQEGVDSQHTERSEKRGEEGMKRGKKKASFPSFLSEQAVEKITIDPRACGRGKRDTDNV